MMIGKTGYSLRPYQQTAIDAAWGYLCSREGNPVIVAPTGAGKSIIIADLARQAVENGLSVLVLAHRKELLSQNAEKVRSLLPSVPIGLYSAGLRKKDTEDPVIVAGIQSVYQKAFDFGERHLVVVDEAHLIPDTDSGMYRTFLADMAVSNPKHRMIGLTATAYRMSTGTIYGRDQIFSGVAHEIPIGELIDRGFLCPVRTKPVTEIDTSQVHHRNGEFVRGELEDAFDQHVVLACEETVSIANAARRQSILIFACGVNHAEHIANLLREFTDEEVGVVTGDTPPLERSGILEAFKNNRLRWLVNVDVLTTGFDAPRIDCLAVMRATESPGLFAQMVGRGFRVHQDKEDCLLLDFGGNLKRHGPLDSKDYGKSKSRGGSGGSVDGPSKTCPSCQEVVSAGLRECSCGFAFPSPDKTHDGNADQDSAVLERDQVPQRWKVEEVAAGVHTKRGASEHDPKTFRMNYQCIPADSESGNLSSEVISEWVCVEHDGFALRNAQNWWLARSKEEFPMSAEDAVEIFDNLGLADTLEITTKKEGKYYRIIDYRLGPVPEGMQEPSGYECDDSEIPF